jgi:hypothetical protein
MSPSINEMFSAPGSEAEADFDLDIDKLMAATDTALAESQRFREPQMEDEAEPDAEPAPEPEADTEPEPEEGQPVGEPAGDEETTEESVAETPSTPPVVAADPLGLLPPERRAALLAIDQAVQSDPARRDRILAALRDDVASPEPAAKLPDDFEEGSPAARLWAENQETKRQLAEIGKAQADIAAATARTNAAQAAEAAGAEFARRYPQLENDDVVRIAQAAGGSGLAARLANGADDLKGAYVQALETTMWTNESFRAKANAPMPEAEPTLSDEHKEQGKARKRKLTALSSAASPTSTPSQSRSALETRADGKLTPQSRLSVVGELASKLARERNEGMY